LQATEGISKPKEPPKKKSRSKKREQGGSDVEVDALPEKERQKAGLKVDSSEIADIFSKGVRWTTEQQNLVVDYITSPEVWPTWKENMPHHLEKVSLFQ
jgi:hypothetical protein